MYKHSRARPEQETGREHEADVFGTFDVRDPEYREALRKILEGKAEEYIPFQKAVELVREFSKEDPENPKADFLRDLRIAVEDALPGAQVLGYSAIGTALDFFHRTDAFLVIKYEGRETIISLDATINPEKLRAPNNYKMNVIVGRIPDPNFQAEPYLTAVDEYADRVVAMLRAQQNRAAGDQRSQPHR
jgi:hypothetical protein